MSSAGRWVIAAVPALALLVPATSAARPISATKSTNHRQAKVQVRSIEVPRQVEAGDDLTLAVKLRNTSNRAVRPKLVVSLRKSAHGSSRVIGRERVGRLGADRSRVYEIDVEVPARLSPGRYYVSVCTRRTSSRKSCLTADRKLTVVKRSPSPNPPPGEKADVLVLTESRSAADAHSSTAAGVAALEQAGRTGGFRVDVEEESAGAFTEANLESYRGVVFLNTSGNILSDNEQSAFEHYFQQGGGFVAIHSAIKTEPDWAYMDKLLGTRATGAESSEGASTINVADRVHDATKSLPERWSHTDAYYSFASNVRGFQHVLGTVAGSAAMADHPASWCQDKDGGRAFYVGAGHSAASFADANLVKHLSGAVKWATGQSDPVYSDCGATVLANYKQVKISAPPNLNEPIGFDQLPDGRIIQTARLGQVRLHDPEEGTTDTIANLSTFPQGSTPTARTGSTARPWTRLRAEQVGVPVLLAGGRQGRPAVRRHDAHDQDPDRPGRRAADRGAHHRPEHGDLGSYVGYFQLSRFKFVDAAGSEPAHLDPASEQEIMRVPVNRGACCHVGGDIDFDKAGNLWLVTGDDTPAGGGNSGGFGPFNDLKTTETQTVRTLNATGGTFTITFAGQTTAPIAYNATTAQIQAALEALSNIEVGDITVTSNAVQGVPNSTPANNGNQTILFRGQYYQQNVAQITTDASALTGTSPDGASRDDSGGRLVPGALRRRAAQRAQHERPARQGAAHQGGRQRVVHGPERQPVRGRHAERAARDLRHGLPEPVPGPGRFQGHRVHDRLLARLPDPADAPRAAGHGPRRDRAGAGQLRLAGLHDAERPLLQVGLQPVDAAGSGQPGQRSSATTRPRGRTTSRAGTRGRRSTR